MEMLSSIRGDKHEFCLVVMADKSLIYMVKSIEPRSEPRGTPECTGAKAEQ